MSLSGLFLILFLIIHLLGNLQLLKADGGQAFNQYAYFMTHNPVIKLISYTLYTLILLHAVQGIILWRSNKAARGNQSYAVQSTSTTSFASRYMAWLGIIIFIFLLIHMYQFWLMMKLGRLPMVTYDGVDHAVANLYEPVYTVFKQGGFVAFYVACMIVLGYHLVHGFTSAFQTLGLNHPKYMSWIRGVGYLLGFGLPIGFALIPLYIYFLG